MVSILVWETRIWRSEKKQHSSFKIMNIWTVLNQCCWSRMFIHWSRILIFSIPDLRSRIQNNNSAANITKIENYFILNRYGTVPWRKYFETIYSQFIVVLFTKHIVTKLSELWVRDMGSGIRKKLISDLEVKKAPPRIRNTDWNSKSVEKTIRRLV